MIALLKAEFRKLLTIRSTYVLAGLALALVCFISFWVMGYKGDLRHTGLYMEVVDTATAVSMLFMSIVVILAVTHEYRYNTIMHTLTIANSRTKVLAAKTLTLMLFVFAFLAVAMVLGLAATWIGTSVRDGALIAQEFYYWHVGWRMAAYFGISIMYAIILAVLFRHVVGALGVVFLGSVIENLLGLVLKGNVKYLPFTALEQIHSGQQLSPGRGALIAAIYVVVGWAVAWYLFLRRDAN